ncbi:hypothetical protein [Salegentibacter salarius]|uniref:Uncharacterized protein n=1 Tax=Salegentibacter salarius TaxID=435906 RepID=A0A2N0TQ76_9FLAO|nr:hypothetical protein [Salegentibacter salarius]OEY71624.1 hypothetical protein BHS39_04490 [Salegentibacter salarius]PKD16874.1 hypothetical protein APR40_04490 [Salegentibacter salarius]SLJ91012.1 hypothetical protein SAMN05660445_01078 [Salegentibacter salarius]
MEHNQKNNTDTSKNIASKPVQEKEEPKTGFGRFFSKVGYSIWIAVMVVGGVIAFLVSLLVL